MHKLLLLAILLPLGLLGQNATDAQQKITPELRAAFERGETADFLLIFRERADLREAKSLKTKREKAQFVFSRLQATAAHSQQNALEILRARGASANGLFIVNALAVRNADAALARQLAALPEVQSLCPDPWVHFNGPTEVSDAPTQRNAIEWGVDRIGAPQVWAMGYTGQGVTVGGADTGYDWAHPAIQPHYRGWNGSAATSQHDYNWHDAIHDFSPLAQLDSTGMPTPNPCGLNASMPCDDNSHGTHTMGTMTGDDGLGNQIGVAPGAQWVGCRNMERGNGQPSTYLECFQWFLAPTDLGGQNADLDKAPHVVNNSWYCSSEEGCNSLEIIELLHEAVANLKASGVVVVVSNGNFGGPCATTLGPPSYFEESFSVGATRADEFIAGFSSRGPILADGSGRMKPNVSAPGVQIRSCVRNGNYANFNGTSMAGPHVAGLVALMLSARPELAGHVDDIEDIIEQTAVYKADTLNCGSSLGTALPNHAYGWGRVDALAAVEAALEWQPSVGTDAPLAPFATVAPNPTQSEAIFDFKDLLGKTVLDIFSPEGKLIFNQKWHSNGRDVLRVSLDNQPVGIYFWQLRSENGTASGKLTRG
jgi:subtilisin family serine protease